MKSSRLIFISLFMVLLGACTLISGPTPDPEITPVGTLRPYPSNTYRATAIPSGFVTATLTPTLTPTATPVYHTVKGNEDMFGIALRYGISLEALKTANPTVLPNWMGVGTVLIIPLTPQAASATNPAAVITPNATTIFSNMDDLVCYPDGSGDLTCFVLITNDSGADLENVGGVLTLTNNNTSEILRQTGIMLLNKLQSNTSQPIVIYVNGPIPSDYTLEFEVDVTLPVPEKDDRYCKTELSINKTTYNNNRKAVTAEGSVQLAAGEPAAERIWILAIAYDTEGNVLGVRRWESNETLAPGESLEFRTTVYSMGGEIDRVDVLSEARSLKQ